MKFARKFGRGITDEMVFCSYSLLVFWELAFIRKHLGLLVNLLLKRKHGGIGFTHGKLFVDGVFFCDTLEDQERAVKIDGATAIRTGNYKVIIDMSARFKRRMPLLLNVTNFTGVRIHGGNTAKDTDGCILVGEYLQEGYIKNSRITFNALFARIDKAIKSGEAVTMEII
jgi:hypothetical protein